MATIQQIEQAMIRADQAGDTASAQLLASDLAQQTRVREPSGYLTSAARGAIGGPASIIDFLARSATFPLQVALKAARLPPMATPNLHDWSTQHLPPPQTRGERFAELAGSMAIPGGAAVKLASRATRPLVAATEAASLGGSHLGREVGINVGGEGSIAEVVGTVAGGLSPYGAGSVSRMLSAPHVPFKSQAGQQQALSSFENQRIPASYADITDQAYLQKGAAKLPGGHGVNEALRQRQSEAMKNAVEKLSSPKVDPSIAGLGVTRGIDDWVTNTFKKTANKLAENLDKNVPRNTVVSTTETRKLLSQMDQEKGPFKRSLTPGALKLLKKELDDVLTPVAKARPKYKAAVELKPKGPTDATMASAADDITFEQLRRMRTAIGHQMAKSELVHKIPKADLKRIYGALSEDIKVSVRAAGPEAEKSLARLNNYWSNGIQRIDDYLKPITNKLTPEDAFKMVEKSVKDSPTRLNAIRKTLKPEERELVISAMLQKAGEPLAGAKSAEYTFSPQTFLTNLNRMDEKNFSALAQGTRYHESAALADIKTVANRLREVDKVLKNPSGTAEAVLPGGMGIAALGSVGFGLDATASMMIGMGSTVGGAYGVSKLMTNPAFVNWAVKGSKINEGQMVGHISRLATVLNDESDEVRQAAQQFLEQAIDEGKDE